jgi:hypothetical protein
MVVNKFIIMGEEHIKSEWQIADKDEDDDWIWKDDPKLDITCVKQRKDIRPKHVSEGLGPVAQSYNQVEPVGHRVSYSTAAIDFGFITVLLLSIMSTWETALI